MHFIALPEKIAQIINDFTIVVARGIDIAHYFKKKHMLSLKIRYNPFIL